MGTRSLRGGGPCANGTVSFWRNGSLARRSTDIVLVVVGAVFVAVGLILWSGQQPIEGGIVTTGRIVDHVVKTDSDNSKSTYPVIEFADRCERTHRFENTIGGSGFGIEGKIGQIVTVRYDPETPARAQWAGQPGRVCRCVVGAGIVLWLIELALVGRRLLRGRRSRVGVVAPDRELGPSER